MEDDELKLPSDYELEKEMEMFLKRIENEKKIGNHILFVQSDIKLNSATSFAQYIFGQERLITLIGELHNHSWQCDKPSLSIAEYCEKALKHNSMCKILLEYNKGDFPKKIGSEAIRDVYIVAEKMGMENNIIPFDNRAFFLTFRGQGELYSDRYYNYKTWEEIGNTFIEPFYKRWREKPDLFKVGDNYPVKIKNYLENQYVSDMDITFRTIAGMLGKYPNEEIHKALKDAWKKVADFFILRILLRNDSVNEYIVILGEAHFNNIRGVLVTAGVELGYSQGNSKNCVSMYQTYSFTDK